MDYKKYADIFMALSDETRVEILRMLSKESLCGCKILENFNITQPTLSYHMKTLCEVNLIKCEKRGIWNHYSLNADTINELKEFMNSLKV